LASTVALATALLLVLGGSTATTQERIVIHGADSGSHLRLSMSGGKLVVEGWMARSTPRGCHFTRYRQIAVCSLRRAGAIELRMGPKGDFVEVLDRLPVPLTAHLGDGSDKFIGNGEPDTCYPEGARRDGCWGGPGRDICIMGPGQDGCHGEGGRDYLYGGPGADKLYGGSDRDHCDGTPGWGYSYECERGPRR